MKTEDVIKTEGGQTLSPWLCSDSEFNPFSNLILSPLVLFQAMYMFYALAIVCDDFFVPSLEKICEVCALILSMSELGTGTAPTSSRSWGALHATWGGNTRHQHASD